MSILPSRLNVFLDFAGDHFAFAGGFEYLFGVLTLTTETRRSRAATKLICELDRSDKCEPQINPTTKIKD
jgi:hypothetical protein